MAPSAEPVQQKRLRLFIAIEIPPVWRAALVATIERLEADTPGYCRWARPEGFHLTLAFLGGQPPEQVNAIRRALTQAATGVEPLALVPTQLGAFGRSAALQVVWAGIADVPAGALASLQTRVVNSLREAEVAFEASAFRPHITLGRGRRGRPADHSRAMHAALQQAPPWAEGENLVREMVLFKSELRPDGSIYTALHSSQLGSGS